MPAMTGGTIGSSPLGSQAFSDVATAATDPAFQARVKAMMATVALEVQAEAGTVTNDANRKKLATSVLNQYGNPTLVASFCMAVLADLTTLTSCTNQALLTRGEAVWDSVAGLL